MNIRVENLNKNYKKKDSPDVKVLKNVNLEIISGQKIALTGPSGAGKSTLIHILGLMDRPTSGKVYIDDVDCFEGDDKYLCIMRKKNIGFVFQFHYLMPDFTVLENILLPVWGEKNIKFKQAQNILEKVGLLHWQNHFPNELSGGEQQRAALARALINNPQVIFADEPTGNLDRVTGVEIEKLLFESSSQTGSTLVLVTHNDDLASKTDKVIKMTDGKIV
ncbi:ABC transporter ATP-binding protein [Candidatus Endomicrobiellum agilis]|jgi:lipoprotein-releasing system ATP-binding protein|uniref:ABC transporter ATP-binding protein n=1 Tax=Candidatus Endomicrobiellum agilis TaxID=3238957 RepID=UPI0028519DA0|nr:ABC transporter ATP-binding protein [Endomicrobium sp.]MDR3092663.1 ABC transporter ATP-binding protein [Endomicrobium sp.]